VIESARERIVRWEDPARTAAAAREMSGLELLRAILNGELPHPPLALTLGFRLIEVEEGRVVYEATPAEYHYNPVGTVHGGYALAVFDSALGCAIWSKLPAGLLQTTTDVQVRFIRPMTTQTGLVRCEAKAVHVGRTTGVSEAHLYDAAGKVLGIGTTACAIFRA
jgi:uncharacterized protein (TIGR00369 family)